MSELYRPAALKARRQEMFGEVMLTSPSFARWCVVAGLLLLAALVALVMLGNYRARETVTGYLTSPQGMIQIQPPKAAQVQQIRVADNQRVARGQVLIELVVESWTDEQRLEDARMQDTQARVDHTLDAIARHHQLQRLASEELADELTAAEAQWRLLTRQSQDADRQRDLARNRAKVALKAREKGLISLTDLQQAQMSHVETSMTARETSLRLSRQQQTLAQLRHRKRVAPLEAAQQLGELSRELSSARALQVSARFQGRFVLRAPAAGRVRGLTVKSGQWVTPGQVLATLQTPAPLVARLLLPTRAAGKVQVGQATRIRLAAFPYQKHGLLSGWVDAVSQALVEPAELPSGLSLAEPSYWVTARIQADGVAGELDMRPGMVLSADLLREERRIWQWLAEPLLSLRS